MACLGEEVDMRSSHEVSVCVCVCECVSEQQPIAFARCWNIQLLFVAVMINWTSSSSPLKSWKLGIGAWLGCRLLLKNMVHSCGWRAPADRIAYRLATRKRGLTPPICFLLRAEHEGPPNGLSHDPHARSSLLQAAMWT